ncbi:MAG: exodeoxyribonuclease III [Sphaerochaetaceae bacterium]|nr:exodeoxyribonuclease III [Sphaerochaetaceae bacterium]
MKLISWNVNGLRAVLNKGFEDYFKAQDADVFCLQEIKLSEGQLNLELPGYECFYNYSEKKGYSGTAVFTKVHPLSVQFGTDNEGRICCLEFEDFFVVCVYTPNSQDELRRLDFRMQWDEEFRVFIKNLDKIKPVLVCGDLNVAHKEIDIKNPKTNTHNPGFTIEERDSFTRTLECGFTDTFRYLHPDEKDAYSWWSYRFHAREKNTGWRIDYWLCSDRIKERVEKSYIDSNIMGSDHAPVVIEIK